MINKMIIATLLLSATSLVMAQAKIDTFAFTKDRLDSKFNFECKKRHHLKTLVIHVDAHPSFDSTVTSDTVTVHCNDAVHTVPANTSANCTCPTKTDVEITLSDRNNGATGTIYPIK